MPSVSVERVPVRVFHLGLLGFDHLQIVFRPTVSWAHQDGWYVLEGVRDVDAGGGRLGVEGIDGATTLGEANGGRTGSELLDWIGTSAIRGSSVVAEGGEAIRVWSTLVSYAAEIDSQKFPYIAFAVPLSPLPTINSSSLVASLLYYAGIDIESARPSGLRFSPGTTTLLGTSMDDTLKAGRSFSTLVAGDGRDTLFGSDDRTQIDKMFGGRGDDTFHWSAGLNIIHGGQPGLDQADDGFDTVNYTGAGALIIEAPPRARPHQSPDFIVRHATGEDHLYSVEEVIWDGARDTVSVGTGVTLMPPSTRGDGPRASAYHSDEAHETMRGCLDAQRCKLEVATAAEDPVFEVDWECGILLFDLSLEDPALLSDAIGFDIAAEN